MTREDIIRMAKEAGICTGNSILLPAPDGQIEALDRFAALVAAHEREVWAKYLDDCGEHEHANYIRSRGEVQS